MAFAEQVLLHALYVPSIHEKVQPEKSETVCEAAGLLAVGHSESATIVPSERRHWTVRVCVSEAVHEAPGSCQLPVIHAKVQPEKSDTV